MQVGLLKICYIILHNVWCWSYIYWYFCFISLLLDNNPSYSSYKTDVFSWSNIYWLCGLHWASSGFQNFKCRSLILLRLYDGMEKWVRWRRSAIKKPCLLLSIKKVFIRILLFLLSFKTDINYPHPHTQK